jgi:hypothetical protein
VVKASLVGSILCNILLVMGASMLAGGARRVRQLSAAPWPEDAVLSVDWSATLGRECGPNRASCP